MQTNFKYNYHVVQTDACMHAKCCICCSQYCTAVENESLSRYRLCCTCCMNDLLAFSSVLIKHYVAFVAVLIYAN